MLTLVPFQVTINTLAVRHMMRPFRPGDQLNDHAVPIGEVMQELQTQLAEYRALKEQLAASAATHPNAPPMYSQNTISNHGDDSSASSSDH